MSNTVQNQLKVSGGYTIEEVNSDVQFCKFIESGHVGIAIVPEEYGKSRHLVHKADVGSFAKWIKLHDPQISVAIMPAQQRLQLRSGDFWFPLVYLAQDVALPVYINLVSNYISDKMRGALKGDNPSIHIKAEYRDHRDKTVKLFEFKGDKDALKSVIKKFDINDFMNRK